MKLSWHWRRNKPTVIPMTGPTPPEDVRIVLKDGTMIPVECVYTGIVHGRHQWASVRRMPQFERICVGTLPEYRSIVIRSDL